jgi:sec-independent protein translocase protein TatB
MLRSMFGMGGTEILVILIVALLFLGPDKLPAAAKTISKGIRDIKKQSRVLQRTIEDDEHIGGAIRDLRSALRGEEEPYRPPPKPKELEPTTSATTEVVAADPGSPPPDPLLGPGDPADGGHISDGTTGATGTEPTSEPGTGLATGETATGTRSASNAGIHGGDANGARSGASTAADSPPPASTAPALTFPPTAGQPDDDAPPPSAAEDAALAALVKPAPNTIAHTPRSVSEPSKSSGRKHG